MTDNVHSDSSASAADLRQAFEGMVARLPSQTVLRGDALADYVRQARSAFEANRHRDTANVEGNAAFIALQSTSHYVGYPGVNQLTIELKPDASDPALGESLSQVLRASTRMTLDFLNEAVPRGERDEGMARYKAYIDDLCRRHGYRSKKALFKSTRMVHAERDRVSGDIVLSPTRRFAVDGFQGLGTSHLVHVSGVAPTEEIGRALRTALARCTDEYGK